MLLEQIRYRCRIPDIDVVMFVAANVFDQFVTRFSGGSFRAEEVRAHIVIDPENARAIVCKPPNGFGANQSGRTCDDNRVHDADSSAKRTRALWGARAVLSPNNPCQLARGWLYPRRGKSRIALEHALDQIGVLDRAHQKANVSRVIDERERERQSPCI